jgi:hypothetical protein
MIYRLSDRSSYHAGNAHIIIPRRLADVKVELDTWVRPLIPAWKLDPWWGRRAVSRNVDVEAMSKKLWAPVAWSRHAVAVKGYQLGTKDISSGLDIAGQLDGISVPILDEFLVFPQFYAQSVVVQKATLPLTCLRVEAALFNLEEGDILRLCIGAWKSS